MPHKNITLLTTPQKDIQVTWTIPYSVSHDNEIKIHDYPTPITITRRITPGSSIFNALIHHYAPSTQKCLNAITNNKKEKTT